MQEPASPPGVHPRPFFKINIPHAFFACLLILFSIAPYLFAGNISGVSLDVPRSARNGDIIKVKVNISGGSEGIRFTTTGLRYIRGYFDHIGWCGDPCLVGDQIQPWKDGCGPYGLPCAWSSDHEFSADWFGGPTIEYEVTGCGEATVTPTYLGASHEGPFTLKKYEIKVLDSIVADFKIEGIGCVDDEVRFTNTSCGGRNFIWSFGDGATSTAEHPTHTYKEEGTYEVTLKAMGPYDSDTMTKSVNINSACGKIYGWSLVPPKPTPLPGTKISALSKSLSKDASAVSSSTGYYEMTVVANEVYSLSAQHAGFWRVAGPADAAVRPHQKKRWDVFMRSTDYPDTIDEFALNGYQINNIIDPVNPATGNYYSSLNLFRFPGIRSIDFHLTAAYNSSMAPEDGPLGHGWTHAYHIYILQNDDEATVHFSDGHREFFRLVTGTDSYKAFNCHPSIELSKISAGGWKANIGDGLYWEFNNQGRLTRIYDLNNNAIVLEHSTQLDQITDTQGRVIKFFYTDNHLSHITSPMVDNGNTVSFSYDADGNLTGITDPRGHSWAFTYDNQHRLLTETDRRGVLVLTNVYDASSRIIEQKDASGHSTFLSYEDTSYGKKVTVTMPSGYIYKHEYDHQYNLIGITDAKGLQATFTPGANGKPRNAIDKKGQSASFESNALGLPTAMTNRLGVSTQKTYNDKYQLTSVADQFGHKVSAGYDSKGNLTSIEDPNFDYTQFWINSKGQSRRISYPAHNGIWEVTYNANGTIQGIKNGYDQTTSYQYDAAGRIVQTNYPTGFGFLKRQYDASGNMRWSESPLGYRTSFTHNENNLVLTRTFEPTGATTTYAYDNNGRTTTMTNPMGGMTKTSFDASGNVIASEDPDGVVTRFAYDERNQLVSRISPSGSEMKFGYDPNGNRIWMRDGMGGTWRWTYDAVGRQTSKQDPIGNVTRYERSEDSRRIRTTNPVKREIDYHFDDGGHLIGISRNDGHSVDFSRNTAGMLTRLQDERGNSWRYAYDNLGRLSRMTDPVGKAEHYEYDAMGRLTKIIRRTGDQIQYNYDLDGRLTSMTLPGGGSVTYAYQYDLDTGTNTKAITDAMGTATEVYNKMNRLISRTDVWGSTITYDYSLAGRLKKVGYPNGKAVDYTYDSFGRLQNITDWNNNVTTYTYDSMDRTATVVFPNNSRTSYAYDIRGDLTSIRHQRQDGSDIAGFILARDALGRIIKTDRTGDIPAAAMEEAARTSTYDPVNRIINQTGGAETVTYEFDANGNLTRKTSGAVVTTYIYDVFNRLTSVSDGTNTTTYAYEAAGRRLSKNHNGTETRYQRTGDRVLAFSDNTGNTASYHIYAGALNYSLDESGAIRIYHADPRGSIVAVTDATQSIIQTYAYGPYGMTGAAGTLNNPFQFVGAWGVLADENGLSLMQARYYDTGMGRFITEDPLGTAAGANVYTYVSGDPVNKIDPEGLAETPGDTMPPLVSAEPLTYTEKPRSFTKEFFWDDLDLPTAMGGSYKSKLISYYNKQDPAKGAELERIFREVDKYEDYLQPAWHDFFWRNAPADKEANCESCTRMLTGHPRSSEQFSADLTGLQHFEVVAVGVGIVPSKTGMNISFKHYAPGIVDKSTGKLIAMVDVIGKGLPIQNGGQQTEFWGSQQVYNFNEAITSPGIWYDERSMLTGASGAGIITDYK